MGNAIKFTRDGKIILRARKISAKGDEIIVRFEVEDTGIGISEQEMTELFKPFTQADVLTTRKLGGSGLGLAITQQLAHLMGGEVGVESEVGCGGAADTGWS